MGLEEVVLAPGAKCGASARPSPLPQVSRGLIPPPPSHPFHGPTCSLPQVVERALSTICARFNRSAADPLVAVVRLVGWAHSDDRVAFREMARQLCE